MKLLKEMSTKIFSWSSCVVIIGTILLPCSSFALLHITNNNLAWECTNCHIGSFQAVDRVPCSDCHKNTSGGGYTDLDTIKVATHSSTAIGSEFYGSWERECLDCHQPHQHNALNKVDGLTDDSYALADLTVNWPVTNASSTETTFSIDSLNIHDSTWQNPATWGKKTGNDERGLLLVFKPLDRYIWWEVVDATDTQITIANVRTYFRYKDMPFQAKLVYGMLLRDEVNEVAIDAGGSSTMAIDNDANPEDGFDGSPDGICQVCHTQTTHWLNDGSGSNHFSGWNCTMCHPHDQGFKPVIPLLCPP